MQEEWKFFPSSIQNRPSTRQRFLELESALKVELQQKNGGALLDKLVKSSLRLERLMKARDLYLERDLVSLDHKTINQRLNKLSHIADLIDIETVVFAQKLFLDLPQDQKAPITKALFRTLADEKAGDAKFRHALSAIFGTAQNAIMRQNKVSKVGDIAERLVELVLSHVGLEKNKHFATQVPRTKSGSGSNIDLVLPWVDKNSLRATDSKTYVAIQFSTNDRARAVASELQGANSMFIATFSGFDAAKDMRDIGDAIIKQWDDGNAPVKVVASEVVIAREKRLKEAIAVVEKEQADLTNQISSYETEKGGRVNSKVLCGPRFASGRRDEHYQRQNERDQTAIGLFENNARSFESCPFYARHLFTHRATGLNHMLQQMWQS